MDKIKSSLCGVLKEVNVRPIDDWSHKISELPAPFEGALVIQLWLGKQFDHRAVDFFKVVSKNNSQFADTSETDFRNGLIATLKKLHGQFAFKISNMFDGITGPELEENCDKIFNLLIKNILSESREVSCIYLVNSLKGESFSLPSEGVYFVKKGDQNYFNELLKDDRKLSLVDIVSGKLDEADEFEDGLEFEFAIIVKDNKSFNDSIDLAESKLRKISSVVHARHVVEFGRRPAICSGKQRSRLIQLYVHPDGRIDSGSSSIPSTFPAYCRDQINLNKQYQTDIHGAFDRFSRLSKVRKNKIDVCLHYYNLGMQSNSDIGFVHYSIALDALYGEKGRSERSIEEGILSLDLDGIDTDVARNLYELRCSLIHGGTKSIKSWDKYQHYRKHYQREPFNDLQRILSNSVLCWE